MTGAEDTEPGRRGREQVLASISANLRGTCVYRTIMHGDGRVECAYVSPNVEALLGLPASLFVPDATQFFARIVPEDLPGFRQNLAHAFACRGTAEFVARVRHVDGRLLWGQFRSHLVESRADGAQVRDGVVVDITSAKAAEVELRSVRQRLELALSAACTCIWDYDLAANRIVLDVQWATMRGYPPAETTTPWRPLLAVAHPADRAAIVAESRRAVSGVTDDYRIEQRVAKAGGGWMWIMSHGRVVARDAQGRASRMLGTNTDITAQKSAEEQVRMLNAKLERSVQERTAELAARTEQLEKSERLFRSLIEDINQGYYVADRRSLFTYCSPAVVAYAGGGKERELLGKSVFRIVAAEDRPRVVAAYHEWMRQGAQDGRIEFRLEEKWRGRVVWVEQTSVFVRDAAGALTEIRCSVRNITERKSAEFALAEEQWRTAIFARVGRALAGSETPKEAARKILDAAQELLGWESSWVHLWNEAQQKFEDVADFDLIDGEIREVAPNPLALAGPTPTVRRVMEEGPQLILRENETDAAGAGALFGSNRPTLSLAFVPIRFGRRLIGILSIQSYRRNAYDAAGLKVLHTLATHCAGAVLRQQDAAALRVSNERFQAVFERCPIAVALVTVPEGRMVEFNAAAIAAFGYSREEALGRTAMELGLWADAGEREHYLREMQTKGRVTDFEARMRRKNGEIITVLHSGSLFELAGEKYSLNSAQDITARRAAEQAISHSVASLRATLESTADGILTIGPDGKIASFNRPFRDMWRIPTEVLLAQDDQVALQFVLSQLTEPEQFLAKVRYLYEHPDEESEDVLDFKDGRVFERYSRPMLVQGQAAGRVWSFRDITERNRVKKRMAAFAKLGQQLNATDQVEEAAQIIAGIADELCGWDSATFDLYDAATDRCRSVFNIDVIGGRRQRVPSPRPYAAPTARTRRAIQVGSELILREPPLRQSEGDIAFGDEARLSASLMIVALRHGPHVVGVLSIQSYAFRAYTRDDLDAMQALADHCAGALFRIRATHALRASEERLRLVWEHATDGMRLTDGHGTVVAVNEAFCRIVGKPRGEVEGRAFSECYQASDRPRMQARQHERFVTRQIEKHQERSVTLWDGRVVSLEVSNAFIETDPENPLLLGVFRDVTARHLAEQEKEKMQTRLFQNQKFEALGTLAGGVAHDFNNILAGMLNYTTLAREDCPPTHPEIREYLGEVSKGGQRAKELVRQILLLSRSEGAERVPVQVALVVREALSLLRSTISATIEIKSDIDPRAPLILADASQIHRVIMNLGINAAHAMAARGGLLTVRLRERMVAPALAAEVPDLKPGRHVWVEVADTGCGMEPAVVARIFEPFFTTKKTGEGTGLGLAVVRSVVRTHGGVIVLRTAPGAGTTFELYFPVPETVGAPAATANAENPRGKGQRILLVDDETMVTRSMQLVLQRLGYVVTVFNRPEPALARFEAGPEDFDLVITDFQMPGMTGIELATRLLARRPGVGIYIASGFAGNLTVERVRELGLAGLMRKPIELHELAEELARAFARQR